MNESFPSHFVVYNLANISVSPALLLTVVVVVLVEFTLRWCLQVQLHLASLS